MRSLVNLAVLEFRKYQAKPIEIAIDHKDLVRTEYSSKLHNTASNFAITFDQRKMNFFNVISRSEEVHAADLEQLRQCGEVHSVFEHARENALDSSTTIYGAYVNEGGSEAIQYMCLLTSLMRYFM